MYIHIRDVLDIPSISIAGVVLYRFCIQYFLRLLKNYQEVLNKIQPAFFNE